MSPFDRSSVITLYYCSARGRSELIRYLLSYAGADYRERRVTASEWDEVKKNLPLEQLPVIELSNNASNKTTMLCQSSSIIRTIARMFDLEGKSIEESTRADEAFESLKEINDAVARSMLESDPGIFDNAFLELLPRRFEMLEKRCVTHRAKGLAGGTQFTYADVTLAQMFNAMDQLSGIKVRHRLPADYPHLSLIARTINQLPQIQSHLANRFYKQ